MWPWISHLPLQDYIQIDPQAMPWLTNSDSYRVRPWKIYFLYKLFTEVKLTSEKNIYKLFKYTVKLIFIKTLDQVIEQTSPEDTLLCLLTSPKITTIFRLLTS